VCTRTASFIFVTDHLQASWFTLMLASYGYMRTLQVLAQREDGVHHYIISMHIFPVYRWMPEKRKIEQHNEVNVVALLTALMGVVWGLIATMFYKPLWVGLAASSMSVATFFIYAIDIARRPVIEFIEAECTIKAAVQEQAEDEHSETTSPEDRLTRQEETEHLVWLHAVSKSVEVAQLELVYNSRDHAVEDISFVGARLAKIGKGATGLASDIAGPHTVMGVMGGVAGLGKGLVGGVVQGVSTVGHTAVSGVKLVGNTAVGIAGAAAHTAMTGDLALGNKLSGALNVIVGEETKADNFSTGKAKHGGASALDAIDVGDAKVWLQH
jgi:hypothetical protein